MSRNDPLRRRFSRVKVGTLVKFVVTLAAAIGFVAAAYASRTDTIVHPAVAVYSGQTPSA